MDKETSEIAKLTERISKDPKSKLFVPLAEEYKKMGDVEMAIYVLSEGLKNNPGYVTARSVLGKLLLETGDLAGSQKEFEEVIKAIPDNLLAQRKLGDLCALQGKPGEALKHYKAVLSLNPRDAELASLVSDLEAGRDVRPRLHLPKSQTSPENAGRPQTPEASPPQAQPKAPAMPVKAAVATTMQSRPVVQPERAGPKEVKTEKTATTSAPSKGISEATAQAEAVSPFVSPPSEPEEVLAVEPLEEALPEPESSVPVFDFLAERDHETKTTPQAERVETLFQESRQAGEEQVVSGIVSPTGETAKLGAEEPLSVPAGIQNEIDIVEAEIIKEPTESQEAVPAEAQEDGPEKSDDFTTDTLAELYISQGFYEKAIDIYERMLADNPSSKGLKEKLERVRSMAGGASAEIVSSEAAKESRETAKSVLAETTEYVAPAGAEETVIETEVHAEPHEYRPVSDTEESPELGKFAGFDIFASSPAREYVPRSEPLSTEFEPREYAPPKGGPELSVENVESAHAAPGKSKASKKETIDRLEAWLQNIKKEK